MVRVQRLLKVEPAEAAQTAEPTHLLKVVEAAAVTLQLALQAVPGPLLLPVVLDHQIMPSAVLSSMAMGKSQMAWHTLVVVEPAAPMVLEPALVG
jgi:hypothetical protein